MMPLATLKSQICDQAVTGHARLLVLASHSAEC